MRTSIKYAIASALSLISSLTFAFNEPDSNRADRKNTAIDQELRNLCGNKLKDIKVNAYQNVNSTKYEAHQISFIKSIDEKSNKENLLSTYQSPIKVSIKTNIGEIAIEDRYCQYLSGVTIDITASPTVYFAQQLNQTPCVKNKVIIVQDRFLSNFNRQFYKASLSIIDNPYYWIQKVDNQIYYDSSNASKYYQEKFNALAKEIQDSITHQIRVNKLADDIQINNEQTLNGIIQSCPTSENNIINHIR